MFVETRAMKIGPGDGGMIMSDDRIRRDDANSLQLYHISASVSEAKLAGVCPVTKSRFSRSYSAGGGGGGVLSLQVIRN